MTDLVQGDEKDDCPLPHQIRKPRLTAREKNPQKHKATRNLFKRKERNSVPLQNCKNPSWKFWHPPVCRNYMSETGCECGRTCFFRHVEAEEKPRKKSKKGGAKGSVASLKDSTQLVCVSQDSYTRKSILREEGTWGSKHAVKFSKGTWHQIKIRERKGPSDGLIQKCEPRERSLCAPKFEERSHVENLRQEGCARRAAWDLSKNIYKFKNADKTTFNSPIKARVMPAPTSKCPEEREFVVDSGASVHMMSEKDVSSDELDAVRRSRNPTVVLTVNGELHRNEETQVYAHDDGKEFTKVPRAVTKAKSCLYRQLDGIWETVWSFIMESPHSLKEPFEEWKKVLQQYCYNQRLDEKWLADSMECYCDLRNVQGPPGRRENSAWKTIRRTIQRANNTFGALIECHPMSAKDRARIHQFGKKVLPRLYLGYELVAGWIWKGDITVADLEDLEKLDASHVYPRRFNAKEILIRQKDDEFIIPFADGTAKLLWKDHEYREPTLRREQTVRNEDFSRELHGELGESQPTEPTDDAEACADFWSIQSDFIYRHHNEPRVQLHVPKEEIFPIPLKYIDGTRSTYTDLDVMQEKRVDDYWNVDSNRSLSDSWKGVTKFNLMKGKLPKGFVSSGERLTKVQTTTRPDHVWRSVDQHRSESTKQDNGKTRSQNSTMLDDWQEFTARF